MPHDEQPGATRHPTEDAVVGGTDSRPSFCVVGAGAVGGLLGARLAASGHRTSALARGAALAALRRHGWRLEDGSSPASAPVSGPVTASDDPADLGPHDVVVLAVKGQSLAGLAPVLPALVGPDTVVVTAMNGVPWWFFHGFGGRYAGLSLASVDPGGVLAAAVPAERVLGAVVHLSARTSAPGVAVSLAGNRLILGEPDGSTSARVASVAGALGTAGFEVEVSAAIQRDIWFKLWGNMTMNPVSALTGATADLILDDPLVRAFCEAVMREAATLGAEIGCPVAESVTDRVAVTRRLGALRTSMLQDAEAGRSLELDALLSVVREIALTAGHPVPFTDALLGLSRLDARVRGLYPW